MPTPSSKQPRITAEDAARAEALDALKRLRANVDRVHREMTIAINAGSPLADHIHEWRQQLSRVDRVLFDYEQAERAGG